MSRSWESGNALHAHSIMLSTSTVLTKATKIEAAAGDSFMAQAFIIMQIGNASLDDIAERVLVPVLEECGLTARRVDKHNEGGLLKSEIIRFIQQSEIIIADVTNERPNCYLEIGYAMGIEKFKSLILTAREDHFVDSPRYQQGGPRIHFDLAGYDILRWDLNDLDAFRVALEKRVRHRLAIVAAVGQAELNAPLVGQEWFAEQRDVAAQQLAKSGNTAYMELLLALSARTDRFSLSELNKAAQAAPVHTFGWPIGIYLHPDDLCPHPRTDGIAAEVGRGEGSTYDYWALRRNGDFYWIGSLFEDYRERITEIFFDTRIVRVTEAFLYCARLYSELGLDRLRTVTIQIRHVGLQGRMLSAANPGRKMRQRYRAIENEAVAEVTIRLEQIETELVSLVKQVLVPLFELFDFFELNDAIYEEMVSNFVAGKV
jgi:hypothetical protein